MKKILRFERAMKMTTSPASMANDDGIRRLLSFRLCEINVTEVVMSARVFAIRSNAWRCAHQTISVSNFSAIVDDWLSLRKKIAL